MPPRRLLLFTGTRADWSKMKPLAQGAIGAGYATSIAITGMHMLDAYGATKNEVRSLPGVQEFLEFDNHGLGADQTSVMRETAREVARVLDEKAYDAIIVHGDRVEAHTACTVAAQKGVRIIHVEGGELSGSIDEMYRHACTHFSTYHMVCSQEARDRVIQLGQHPDTVFPIGSPELDVHARDSGITVDDVKKKYGIPFKGDYGIVTFHSVTSEQDTMLVQAAWLFATLEETRKPFVIIMPNNDPGTDAIRAIIEKILAGHASANFFRAKNIEFLDFSTLMKNAAVVVGNSSMGVREVPFLGVASINIGTRQSNRAPNVPSITHAPAGDAAAILTAIDGNWGKKFERDTTFGRGTAEKEFVEALASPGFWDKPLQKSFYHG